jgi:hypothetical protein
VVAKTVIGPAPFSVSARPAAWIAASGCKDQESQWQYPPHLCGVSPGGGAGFSFTVAVVSSGGFFSSLLLQATNKAELKIRMIIMTNFFYIKIDW